MSKIRIKNKLKVKAYEVRVEFTDTVLGIDEQDALTEYKKWLDRHTKGWKIKDVYEVESNW